MYRGSYRGTCPNKSVPTYDPRYVKMYVLMYHGTHTAAVCIPIT